MFSKKHCSGSRPVEGGAFNLRLCIGNDEDHSCCRRLGPPPMWRQTKDDDNDDDDNDNDGNAMTPR